MSDRELQWNNTAAIEDYVETSKESHLPILVQTLREKLNGLEKYSNRVRIADDEFLSMFIRVKSYDVDRALQAVEKYYHHYEAFPEFLTRIRTSSEYKSVYDSKTLIMFRGKTEEGSTVTWIRISKWDITKHSVLTMTQGMSFYLQETIQSPEIQLFGCVLILDLKNLSLAQVRKLRPADLKFGIQACQDGLPLRLVAVHIINYPVIFYGVYYIMCQFLKEKMRKRIHWHKSTKSLLEYLDQDSLPESLGGTCELDDVEDERIVSLLVQNDLHYADYYA